MDKTMLMITVFLLLDAVGEGLSSTPAVDIGSVNNLPEEVSKPPVNLDPKLRRALLRVLTKLEEEDKEGTSEGDVEPNSNVVSEEDFIKFFTNKGVNDEIFHQTKEPDYGISAQEGQPLEMKAEEHPPYVYAEGKGYQQPSEPSQEGQPQEMNAEKNPPYIFVEGKEYQGQSELSHMEETVDDTLSVAGDKYPSTFPTPQQDAIFFQIPEPIQIPDPVDEDEMEEPKVFNTTSNETLSSQETRSIQNKPVNAIKTEDKMLSKEVLKEVETLKSDEGSNGTVKLEKHEVEFYQAPLVVAFTVQQDEKGLPKRVIPLNYVKPGPLLLPTEKELLATEQAKKQQELEEKQKLLDQQLRVFQQQQERIRLLEERKRQEEELKRQQEFTNQQQALYAQQRQQFLESQQHEQERLQQQEARKRQQDILFGSQRQQGEFRYNTLQEQEKLRLLRLQEERQRPSQQNVEFQRSVDFNFRPPNHQSINTFTNFNRFQTQPQFQNAQASSFQPLSSLPSSNFQPPSFKQPNPTNFQSSIYQQVPSQATNIQSGFQQQPFQSQSFQPAQSSSFQPNLFELNRINRQEARHSVGNFGFSQPYNADNQLQSLLYQTGITSNIRSNAGSQEDLNIVSKVLALNHGNSFFHNDQVGDFSGSVQHVLKKPSRDFEPPTI